MARPAVLITGGAKRIGAAIARRFGEAGWHVVIHCNRSLNAARELAAALPSAEAVHCDLADTAAAVTLIEGLAARLDDWRVLVNCASIFADDEAGMLDAASFDRTMRVNAVTPSRMAQAFLAHSKAEGGRRVVDVTDQKVANPNPDFFSYSMSKQALALYLGTTPENLWRSFVALEPHGVGVRRREVLVAEFGKLSEFAGPNPLLDRAPRKAFRDDAQLSPTD